MKNQKVTITATDMPNGKMSIEFAYDPPVRKEPIKGQEDSSAINFSLDVIEMVQGNSKNTMTVTRFNETRIPREGRGG